MSAMLFDFIYGFERDVKSIVSVDVELHCHVIVPSVVIVFKSSV